MINCIYLNRIILQLCFFYFVKCQYYKAQPALPESYVLDTTTKETTRMTAFVDIFVNVATNSKQLSHIFNTSLPTDEITAAYSQAFLEALTIVGIEDPQSVSETLSDAAQDTYPRMHKNATIYAAADAIAFYLLSQNAIPKNTGAAYAVAFSGAILQNYPDINRQLTTLSLIRTFSNGINDYLLPLNVYKPAQAPVISLSLAKQFYALTDISEPKYKDKELYSASTNTAYGLKLFTETFMKEVSTSSLLGSVFNLSEPYSEVSKAWNDVIAQECTRLGCPDVDIVANRFSKAVDSTFSTKLGSTYAADCAGGYALYAMSQEYLTPSTVVTLPQELASAIQNSLPLNADLFTKTSAIVNGFRVLSNIHSELKYSKFEFGAILYFTQTEFFASSEVRRLSAL